MIFHFPFPRARARVLACVWLPLPRAMFCLERDCAAIFTAGESSCPACGGTHFMPLARWLKEQ